MPKLSISTACTALALAAWLGNALYALGEPAGTLKYWSPALVAGAMIAFVIIHGRRCYSGRELFGFAATVFLVGWLFETISVATGFPFGSYHYADVMEPFLGQVPVFVMPAYCVMGYISWSMARILLNRFDGGPDAVLRFGAPAVAAALMVTWDLSMDPLRATVEGRWVWLEGGPHFGVPIENYFGWALVTWVMFQSFALVLGRDAPARGAEGIERPGLFWLSVPLFYVAFAVEYVLNPFVASWAFEVVLVNGLETPVDEIYAGVALIAAMTMLPVALLAAALVQRRYAPAPAGAAAGRQAAPITRRP